MRWLWRALGVLAVLAVVAAAFGYYYLKTTTTPRQNGRLPVAGLGATAEIVRDQHGVIQVKAKSLEDLYFAQGFAHAQERLWQMEFQRRLGAGRLAEVLGEAALPIDRFMRTLGVYRAAKEAYRALGEEARRALDAYIAGVNAYLASGEPLPLEFRLLGYRPEPFRPEDSLVWAKLMSWELSRNYERELLRFRLLARGLSKERINELMPPYPEDAPKVLSGVSADPYPGAARQAEALLAFAPGEGEASNNWVVSPRLVKGGFPLLANDPHLKIQAPSVWILMELVAPGHRVVGASFPGLPGIVIGKNEHIAWGVTNLGADVQDLYVLEEREGGYLYKGEVRPFATRTEEIRVKGGKVERLVVRESAYGPVISDVVEVPGGKPVSLRWVSLDPGDTTLEAFLRLQRAKNWPEFVAALRYYVAPSQNFVYADREGNIGYYAPGKIPIRREGHTGAFPVPGTGEWDWRGWVPFEELPQVLNPKKGYIVTANNKPTGPDYPYNLGVDWAEPYRARRITELIEGRPRHDLGSMAEIQLDEKTLLFEEFLPVLRRIEPRGPEEARWLERLLSWDGVASADSEVAAVFEVWYTELSRLPAPEVGEEFWDEPRYLKRAMLKGDPACTARGLTCLDYASEAFGRALERLKTPVPWGQLHVAEFAHAVMKNEPRLAWLFRRRVAKGGDRYTPNVGLYRPEDFSVKVAPSYRQLIEVKEGGRALFIHAPGQSGNPLSPHYGDLVALWARGEYLKMGLDRPRARLVLEPTR